MENIYKVKIRSNPDPRGLYPSERRYSASTVLGLGVVHLALAATALLLASIGMTTTQTSPSLNPSSAPSLFTTDNYTDDVLMSNEGNNSYYEERECGDYNISLAPCVTALGALAAGLAGFLAWKKWYIDQNIKWFFLMSIISTITSLSCIIAIITSFISIQEDLLDIKNFFNNKPKLRLTLSINVLITDILEVILSILSAKLAFKGMKNEYPDDIIISKNRGKIEVNTVMKGSKKTRVLPPDIINHFPNSGKLAKYLPKVDNGSLPKAESSAEYQERVRKFLAANDGSINEK